MELYYENQRGEYVEIRVYAKRFDGVDVAAEIYAPYAQKIYRNRAGIIRLYNRMVKKYHPLGLRLSMFE